MRCAGKGVGVAAHDIVAIAAVQLIVATVTNHRVGPRTSVQKIVAMQRCSQGGVIAFQKIIARAARQLVVRAAANQTIVAVTAIQVIIAMPASCGIAQKPDIDRVSVTVEFIIARAAHQHVGPGAAHQIVIVGAAIKVVVATLGNHDVIARAAQHQVCILLRCDLVVQSSKHNSAASCVTLRVVQGLALNVPCAKVLGGLHIAEHVVSAAAAYQQILASTAEQRIVSRITDQDVIAVSAVKQIGLAGWRGSRLRQHLSQRLPRDGIHLVVTRAAIGDVATAAQLYQILAGACTHLVVTGAAFDPVVATALCVDHVNAAAGDDLVIANAVVQDVVAPRGELASVHEVAQRVVLDGIDRLQITGDE